MLERQVSNTLVLTFIAQGLGRKEGRAALCNGAGSRVFTSVGELDIIQLHNPARSGGCPQGTAMWSERIPRI
jgi:hypothetical protein